MWKVNALKTYLRKRGLKVTGRKEELLARVFIAVEQNVPEYLEAADIVLQTKLEQRSLLTTAAEGDLPDPSTIKDGWIGELVEMELWPPIFLSDLTMYIMKDHPGNDNFIAKTSFK